MTTDKGHPEAGMGGDVAEGPWGPGCILRGAPEASEGLLCLCLWEGQPAPAAEWETPAAGPQLPPLADPSPHRPPGHRERHVVGGQPQQLGGQPADHAGGQPDPERQSPARPGAPGPRPGSPSRPVARRPPPAQPAGPGPVQPARAAGAPAQPQQRRLHQPGLHPPRLHGPLGRGGRGRPRRRGRRGRGQRALGDAQQPVAHVAVRAAAAAAGAPAGPQVQQHQQPGRRPRPRPRPPAQPRPAPRPGPEPLLGGGPQQGRGRGPLGAPRAAARPGGAAAGRRGQQAEEMRAAGAQAGAPSHRLLPQEPGGRQQYLGHNLGVAQGPASQRRAAERVGLSRVWARRGPAVALAVDPSRGPSRAYTYTYIYAYI